MGADELSRNSQQVIQGEQQGTPQLNHHHFLGRGEHGLQVVGRVRVVPKDIALLSLVDRLLGDPEALGQSTGCLVTGCDLSAHGGYRAGVLMQGNQHGVTTRMDCKDSINSCRTARAMKSG